MRKGFIVFVVVTLLSVFHAKSHELIGGDITWECISSGSDAGKYIFQLTLFNHCDSGSMLTTYHILTVTNGPVSTITCSFVSETNINLDCYEDSLEINCANHQTGAVSKGIYRSAPVSLNGVPGSTGWDITFGYSSHVNAINVLGNPGFTLKSTMYSSNGKNASPCFDNSPVFLGDPISHACIGYPMSLNHMAYDPDMDKLFHSFSRPISSIPTNFITWKSGFSTNYQFPNANHSALNGNPTILWYNGEVGIEILDATLLGKVRYAIKHSSYRDSVLISEITRDFMVEIDTCPSSNTLPPLTNTPPVMVIKKHPNNPVGLPNPWIDTVFAGDTVRLFMTTTDIQYRPPGLTAQNNIGIPYSAQFSPKYSNSSGPCIRPPCATLDTNTSDYISSKNRWEGIYGVSMNFDWIIDSSHGSSDGTIYNFHFYTQDDWCPRPGINLRTHTVVVYGDDTTETSVTEHHFKENSIQIYPNPSSNIFTIDLNKRAKERIVYDLFNITGEQLDNGYLVLDGSGSGKLQVNLSSQPKGIYFIRLSGDHLNSVKKLVLR